jgi:hypothetical protein
MENYDMEKKAKKRKRGVKCGTDKDLQPKSHCLDILGAYRKNIKNGVRVMAVHISCVPTRDFLRFKSALTLNEDTIKSAFMRFMDGYSRSVENKFHVDLDVDTPTE